MNKKGNVTNEDLMVKLEEIDEDSKRSKNLAIVMIGIALIAIAIPLMIELSSILEYTQWAIVAIYFGMGMFFILLGFNGLKKKGK